MKNLKFISAPELKNENVKVDTIIARHAFSPNGTITNYEVPLQNGRPYLSGYHHLQSPVNGPVIYFKTNPVEIIFFEKSNDSWSPVGITLPGRIDNIEIFEERVKALFNEAITKKDIIKICYNLCELSNTGFNYVVEETRCYSIGVPASKIGLVKNLNLYFKLGTVCSRYNKAYGYGEYLIALKGLQNFFNIEFNTEKDKDIFKPSFSDAQFFGAFVINDYIGSESMTADNAMFALNFTFDEGCNVTPSRFQTLKIENGWVMLRPLGNQYIIKVKGSWFICDPRRGVIKTISENERVKLFALIDKGLAEYWNAEYECPKTFFKY